jgi:hypothetical protein
VRDQLETTKIQDRCKQGRVQGSVPELVRALVKAQGLERGPVLEQPPDLVKVPVFVVATKQLQ